MDAGQNPRLARRHFGVEILARAAALMVARNGRDKRAILGALEIPARGVGVLPQLGRVYVAILVQVEVEGEARDFP